MAGQVSVRLAANVDAYIAAMRRAEASTTGFSRSTQRNMTRVGGEMQTLGRTMSIGVTLPVAALGVASTKMAMDWETSFAQMVGLANVPAEEVDHLKESVLELAGATAVAPQELADALYFAASAGLDAAQAMDVVEMAAQASAAGMGSTVDIVTLVSSAMAAYGPDAITAAQATDMLTAAVREGKAAPQEMAASLGRVMPVAAQLGVSFDEVAGATAFMSNIFGSAEETTVRLNGVLRAMLSPTEQGKKALEDMGTSTAELHAAIAQDGLLGGLELLREHGFLENSEALNDLFDDSRAAEGAMVLLEDASGRLVPTMNAVRDSTGATGDAFATAADTDAFKMKQALTELKVAMIEIGEIILPIAAKVGSAIADMAGFFSDLPDPVQDLILAFAGLAATAGPMIFMAGSVVRNFVAIQAAMAASSTAASTTAKGFSLLSTVAAVGIAIWNILGEGHLNASAHIEGGAEALDNSTRAAYDNAVAAKTAGFEVDSLASANIALSQAITAAADPALEEALARLNITGDDTLEMLVGIKDGSVSMADILVDGFGMSEQAAASFLAIQGDVTSSEMADYLQDLYPEFNMTADQIDLVSAALSTLDQFAIENSGEIDAMALSWLDATVRGSELGKTLVEQAEDLHGARTEAGNAIPVYQEVVAALFEMDPAAAAAVLGLDSVGGAAGDATGPTEDLAEAVIDASAAMDALKAADLAHVTTEIAKLADLADRPLVSGDIGFIERYGEALHSLLDPVQGLVRAHDAYHTSANTFTEDIDGTSLAIGDNSEEALNNRGVLMDWMDQIIGVADAQLAAGDEVKDVNDTLFQNTEAMVAAAVAAGFNEDEVRALVEQYGLVPGFVDTAIKLSHDQLGLMLLEGLIGDMETLDAGTLAELEVILETEGAMAGYQYMYDKINNATPTMNAQIRYPKIAVTTSADGRSVSVGTIGHAIAAQQGAYIRAVGSGGIGALLHSDEVVLPLGNQGRMAALLGLPEVGPRVAAAMTAWLPAGGGGGGALPPITIYNNGRDLTAADVARAIEMSRTAA